MTHAPPPPSADFDRGALDAIASSLGDAIEHARAAPLSKRTTFGIGGPADLLVVAREENDVVRTLGLAADRGVPVFVLGGGSNLLVGDGGIRGVVLTLSGTLGSLHVHDNGRTIDCGAGVTYPRLTRTALDCGWKPAVGWMGTPGQVGGALIMNAGTRHGEIGDCVVEVRAASADGPLRFSKEACGFAYRKSAFPSRVVLTGTLLQCDSSRTDEVEGLDAMAKELLHKRHASQPKLRSAGSIFKNPPGDFAGRLIEAAGLKGYAVGKAKISEVHANFVVNTGGASAADVVAVADHAKRTVKEKFGIDLEWEVKRVGEFHVVANAHAGEAQ